MQEVLGLKRAREFYTYWKDTSLCFPFPVYVGMSRGTLQFSDGGPMHRSIWSPKPPRSKSFEEKSVQTNYRKAYVSYSKYILGKAKSL